jgi:membrane-associated PAP2 superfamily phosphatase
MASGKSILIAAFLLGAAIVFFGVSGADIWIQSHFYNAQTHRWLVDANEPIPKFIFYDGIKRLLIVVGVLLLIGSAVAWKRPFFRPYRRGMVIVLLASVLVPVVVGSL